MSVSLVELHFGLVITKLELNIKHSRLSLRTCDERDECEDGASHVAGFSNETVEICAAGTTHTVQHQDQK